MKTLFGLVVLVMMTTSVLAAGSAATGSGTAVARKPIFVDIYFLNKELRFERDIQQELVARNSALNFAVGGRYNASSLLFEYGTFTRSSGNSTLSISSTRREYSLWGKQNLFAFEYCDLFAELGLGAYQEEVRTTLGGTSVTDQGALSAMGGAGGGFSTVLFKYVTLSLEARLLLGSNFDPNPEPGLLFRSGVEF